MIMNSMRVFVSIRLNKPIDRGSTKQSKTFAFESKRKQFTSDIYRRLLNRRICSHNKRRRKSIELCVTLFSTSFHFNISTDERNNDRTTTSSSSSFINITNTNRSEYKRSLSFRSKSFKKFIQKLFI